MSKNTLKNIQKQIEKAIGLNDLFVFGGLALFGYGMYEIYNPLGFVSVGLILLWLGIRS